MAPLSRDAAATLAFWSIWNEPNLGINISPYLPVSRRTKQHPVDVWGCVRPASDAAHQTGRTQYVLIQFRAPGGTFRTVRRVPIISRHGYYEVRETFSGSGWVRSAWTYPRGPEIFSHTAQVTLH